MVGISDSVGLGPWNRLFIINREVAMMFIMSISRRPLFGDDILVEDGWGTLFAG